MNALILGTRAENGSSCYLCSISLEDYIYNLPDTYSDYDIQRGIVTNVYLDQLVDTVLNFRHIPPIVLVVEKGNYKKSGNSLSISVFKILDGLQRTHRLKIIRDTIDYYLKSLAQNGDIVNWSSFKLSRTFSKELRAINSNTDILKSIISFSKDNDKNLLDCYRNNEQWFEIWTNLTAEQEVRKMLMLNAGHKAVKTRHQLELLFLNILPILQKDIVKDFTLVREKELSATLYSKKRSYGQFHFSHIVAALLSLVAKRPITTNTSLIQSIQEGDFGIDQDSTFLTIDFLKEFISFLLKMDKLLSDQYTQIGRQWVGREVALTGMFGAFGSVAEKNEKSPLAIMKSFLGVVQNNAAVMNLTAFEEERNKLELSKVNIGSANKMAVFSAIEDLLTASEPKKINWARYFGEDEQ